MKTIKTITLALTFVGLLLVTTPGVAFTQEEGEEPQNPVALFLAGVADVSYDEIKGFQESGYGLGNIGRALNFAEATGQELSDVLAEAQAEGWGQMYKAAGLHPGGQGLGRLIKQGNEQGPPEWAGGPPDHAGPKGDNQRPEQTGRPESAETNEDAGGPPDHAGPKDKGGPPDHAGPKEKGGPPDHAGPKNRGDEGESG